MQELDDIALLREYVGRNSEDAFATLVTRHIDKVYSVALRHTGNPHQAEEITQAVFVILARKSSHLSRHVILGGWLYETARLTAVTFIRSEIRRARREQEAYMQNVLNENEADIWPQIAPLLDSGLAGLNKTERHAVVLRFFYGKSMKEIGTALGGSEDTARMRINRALEKLRQFFFKRGIASTPATLAGAISANSVQTAPAMLAKSVTAVAIAKGAAASGSTLTLIKGTLKIMAWTKMKTAVVAGVVVLLAAGTTTITVKGIQKHRAGAWETESFNPNIVRVLNAAPPLVEILPTKFPQSKGWGYSGGVKDSKLAGVGKTLKDILYWANTTDLSDARLIFPGDLSSNKYDYVVNLATGSSQALQEKVAEQFGLVQTIEVRETNVFLLQVANRNAQGLKPHKGNATMPGWYMAKGTSTFTWDDMSAAKLARFLEMYLATPVIDRTGLSGNFDIKLKLAMDEFPADWKDHNIDDFQPALLNQLGLELVPGRESVEMLGWLKNKVAFSLNTFLKSMQHGSVWIKKQKQERKIIRRHHARL